MIDVLSCMLSRAIDRGLIKDLTTGSEEVTVSHLQFANDMVLFQQDDRHSFMHVFYISNLCGAISSLKINLAKSGVAGINADSQNLSPFATLIGCYGQILQ